MGDVLMTEENTSIKSVVEDATGKIVNFVVVKNDGEFNPGAGFRLIDKSTEHEMDGTVDSDNNYTAPAAVTPVKERSELVAVAKELASSADSIEALKLAFDKLSEALES